MYYSLKNKQENVSNFEFNKKKWDHATIMMRWSQPKLPRVLMARWASSRRLELTKEK